MPLDPLADLHIFVWPKIPLLLLSLPLTDVWGPHVSFFFNLLSTTRCPPPPHLPPSACSPPGGTPPPPPPPPRPPLLPQPHCLPCVAGGGGRGKLRQRRSGLGAVAAVGLSAMPTDPGGRIPAPPALRSLARSRRRRTTTAVAKRSWRTMSAALSAPTSPYAPAGRARRPPRARWPWRAPCARRPRARGPRGRCGRRGAAWRRWRAASPSRP